MSKVSEWEVDCLRWRGRVLTGQHSHYCDDWDGPPMDETCGEWPCVCCKHGWCLPSANISETRANSGAAANDAGTKSLSD